MTCPECRHDNRAAAKFCEQCGALLVDGDLGFFIIDRAGVIRRAMCGNYVAFEATKPVGVQPIPSNEGIIRELEGCQASS